MHTGETSGVTQRNENLQAEMLVTLCHEFGKALMQIQSELDQLHAHNGDSGHLQMIRARCNHAASVLHGTIGLMVDQPLDKEVFSLSEYLESMLPHFQSMTAFPLALKTHQTFRVNASRQGLGNSFSLLLNTIQQPEDRELYIEIYPHPEDEGHYGVVTFNVEGALREDNARWKMLQTMIELQGAHLIQEVHDHGLRCHLMIEQYRQHTVPLPVHDGVDVQTAAVVEHDPQMAGVVGRLLRALGFTNVEVFHHPDEALLWLKSNSPAVILVEYNLPGVTGIDLLQQAKGAVRNSALAVMCGMIPKGLESKIQFLGLPVQVLIRPFGASELFGLYQKSQTPRTGHGDGISAEITESMKNTLRLERPRKQQCPQGFTADDY